MVITSRSRWLLFVLLAVACVGGCDDDDDDIFQPGTGDGDGTGGGGGGSGTTLSGFARTDLVSDQASDAKRVDPDLVNAWGIAPVQGWLWIADEATGKVSIYDGDGNPKLDAPASGSIDLGPGITGLVADPTNQFMIGGGPNCPPAEVIFASQNGQLIAFNNVENPIGGTVVVDRPGAVYTGVTIARDRVLAADLVGKKLDVFDTNFAPVDLAADQFTDPDLPAEFGPFNVMTLGEEVLVAYAEVNEEEGEEEAGRGLGIIDAYDLDGNLLRRVATGGDLNAPWGMAIAPDTFGVHAGQLLVGNFGDGLINTFDLPTGKAGGLLADTNSTPLAVDGLWGLTFGAGGTAGSPDVLYFAAGPQDETHGLYGRIAPVTVTTAANE